MSPRMQRAALLFERGRFIEAESEIRATLADGDDSSDAHAMLGLCLLKAGVVEDARRELETGLARDPGNAYSHYAMSFLDTAALARNEIIIRRPVRDAKLSRSSLESASRAVELDPTDETYLVRLAEVYQAQWRWQESIAPAEAALRLSPGHCSAAVTLSLALMQLRREREAREVLHRALEMNPSTSLAHAGMGWALLRVGDYQRAEQFFNEALRMHAGLTWAQEGALECAKHQYRLYRELSRIKRWYEKQSALVTAVIVLGIAAAAFGFFSAYLFWADPFLRRHLGNSGFGILTLVLLFGSAGLMFFHNEIFLWLIRRHVASKTTVGSAQRRFGRHILTFIAFTAAFVPMAIFVERYSKAAPMILIGLISGVFSIVIVIKTFAAGKRRRLWLAYVLFVIAATPFAIIAWFNFVEDDPELMRFAVVTALPFIPLLFACDAENKKALKRKHTDAVTQASRPEE